MAEIAVDLLRRQAQQTAVGRIHKIPQHPAGDGGVEHHQNIAARHGYIAVGPPFFILGYQHMIHPDGTLLTGTAHGKLHGQHRQAHDQQEKQINQHKSAAAILSGHIGKLPDVAHTDGTACAEENETETAS